MSKANVRGVLWETVKFDIEARIIKGEYKAGDKLPSITELSEQYDIGKTTAQKIIGAFCDEEIAIKRVGVGCFVKPYIKDKLLAKHKQRLQAYIISLSQEAELLGIENEQLIEMIAKNLKP